MKNISIQIDGINLPIIEVQGLEDNKHFSEIMFCVRGVFNNFGLEGFKDYSEDEKDYFTHDICEFITKEIKLDNISETIITIGDKQIKIKEIYYN